jgi:GntR family transcriptional repressor for pyruvate dehydrogenase complex
VFLGLVQVRRGEGTFVGSDSTRLLDRFLLSGLLRSERDIGHLCETRIVLESELVSLCAQRAGEEDIAALEKLERDMEAGATLSTPGFVDLDLQFHLRIAEASGNPVLAQLLRTIRGLLQEWIVRSQTVSKARDAAKRGHTKILAALRERDGEAARAAMRGHLEESFELMRKASLAAKEKSA